MNIELKLTFITPCFSQGATDTAEIRPASIRGMLHQWFRLLGGTFQQEREVFGGVKAGAGTVDQASRVVVRVRDIQGSQISACTLPHKSGDEASPRNAYSEATHFTLAISDRLGGLSKEDEKLFKKTVYAWLLMGTLGYRATRAAGSFFWESTTDFPYPETPDAYDRECQRLVNSNFMVALLKDTLFYSSDEARRVVSDTLGGRQDSKGKNDLKQLHDPLGKVFEGRKTSPLKFRIVKFGTTYYIVAIWDNRSVVTGNQKSDFSGIIKLLSERKPQLGGPLSKAFHI